MPAASTAQIHPSVVLEDDVEVGHFAVIGAGVEIGEGSRLGHHVVVHDGSRLGPGVRVDDHAVIGKRPMRAARSATTSAADLEAAVMGADTIVGTGAVVYRGATIGERVLIADYATVRERVSVGSESIVGRGVAIENDSTVGARCKLETNVYVTAYSTIEDDVFVAPGVLTSNDAYLARTEARKTAFAGPTVRESARIGVGAVLLPGLEVGSEAVVAAGAVLSKDATGGRVHVGVPARDVRAVAPEQLRENGG
ncbi:DapH/DapD/GlmU-related protein [Rubrivirga sp.]|uniref:acyltransferase n=1 Tax=Rubrivirga sp. TaxID=1885344 RepID=UPI003C719250